MANLVNFGPQMAMNDMVERVGIPNSGDVGTGKPISATFRNILVKLIKAVM